MMSVVRRIRNIHKISPAVCEYCIIDGVFRLTILLRILSDAIPRDRFDNYEHYVGDRSIAGSLLWVYYTEILRENVTLVEFKLL